MLKHAHKEGSASGLLGFAPRFPCGAVVDEGSVRGLTPRTLGLLMHSPSYSERQSCNYARVCSGPVWQIRSLSLAPRGAQTALMLVHLRGFLVRALITLRVLLLRDLLGAVSHGLLGSLPPTHVDRSSRPIDLGFCVDDSHGISRRIHSITE